VPAWPLSDNHTLNNKVDADTDPDHEKAQKHELTLRSHDCVWALPDTAVSTNNLFFIGLVGL
jgi:hypothetical protein